MNERLLHSEVQIFIRNYSEEIAILAFKGSPFEGISVQELIQQIEGFRKTEKKLPLWNQTIGIYFPPKISIEQTSSEITARYKASLVTGKSTADITGGFGVDSFYFAERFEQVEHFEQDEELSEIAISNFKKLKAYNIQAVPGDGLSSITNKKYDVIYVDPARRHAKKGKVFLLSDCDPNVVDNLRYLLERCDTLMIKTSHMLDLSMGLKELQGVSEIHVVAVGNEVKELLWVLRNNTSENITIATINFTNTTPEKFEFTFGKESLPSYALPLQYLYEPNAAIMKAGGFYAISEHYNLSKLHPNSHLYTSEKLVDFPGRRFIMEKIIPYHKKEIKASLANSKANITTRNFPETVKDLRKKWKIKEGGDVYLFFTTIENNDKVVLVCKKIDR